MRQRRPFDPPEDKRAMMARATRLEWITIFFNFSIIAVMFLTMGSSQAMKTAWIEDMLSMIPPVTYLITLRVRNRHPDQRFPYGYRRAPMLGFMAASASVLTLGLYMLIDSAVSLFSAHHPTLGHFTLYGTSWDVWSGWVMIGALLYGIFPPVVLGRMKIPLAADLHEKTLYADAAMNKANWTTGLAAILGIVGIGLGFWWADAAAAALISLDVIRDGAANLKHSMADLMDQQPTKAGSDEQLALVDHIRAHLRSLTGVLDADVRLREEGHVISGELFVVLDEHATTPERLESIGREVGALDWRLYDLVVVPVRELEIEG